MKPNISKIAKELGFSRSTVSRAINGSCPVNPEKRKLILVYTEKSQNKLEDMESRHYAPYVIGVGLPSRPAFFWDEALDGILRASGEYSKKLLKIKIVKFSGDIRGEEETLHVIDMLEKMDAEAYMLVPFSSSEVVRRLEKLAQHAVVAVFNDYIDFKGRFLYAGPNHYEDGQKAAAIITGEVKVPRKILVISPSLEQASVSQRVNGFTTYINAAEDSTIIGNIISDSCNALTPSILAREISKIGIERFNCIYVADGALHLVGSALIKLGLLQSIYCVGHEFSKQSEKQFLSGLSGAYIKQDIFSQGYTTVKRLADYMISHTGTFGADIISGYETKLFNKGS